MAKARSKAVMKKKLDGGFSLVELIVVIAIMAVLVGVLAPAYLRYLEKSRKSTDIQTIDQVMEAAVAVSTEEEYHVPRGAHFEVIVTGGTVTLEIPKDVWDAVLTHTEDDDYRTIAETEWKEVANGVGLSYKSKEWRSINGVLTGETNKNGELEWSHGTADVFQKMEEYSPEFAKKMTLASDEEDET